MRSLYIVIVGCGRLGSYLANRLSREGHRLVVIDLEERAFANLSSDSFSGFRVEGDASEAATLERAGIGQADWLVAATQDDNLNLMVAMVARELHGVSRVVARAYDPHRVEMYSQLGLPTVCPTVIAGERLLDAMASPAPPTGGAA